MRNKMAMRFFSGCYGRRVASLSAEAGLGNVERRGMVRRQRTFSTKESGKRVLYSREERRVRRQELFKKQEGTAVKSGVSSASTRGLWLGVGLSSGLVGIGGWALLADPRESELARSVQESAAGSAITSFVARLCAPFVNPAREKLLPDWPPDYLNISPDVPCPHTLVLDLEETLVCSQWDRRYGWRHAKRPGVENFLREMAKYYEIVIYTPNIASVAEPVVFALDKDGCVMHRLYRDATHFVRGTHCKDITKLNRDPNKIIVIDDDPRAIQLCSQNAVLVKPYLDGTDRIDSELEDLIPFLAAVVNEHVTDIPAALRKFSDNKATTISHEYKDLLQQAKQKTDSVRGLGIGGFVNANRGLAPATDISLSTLTAKDIVGDAPPPEPPTKGRLFQRFHDKSKQVQENQKRKLEAWHKVMQKKEQQKRLLQTQQQQQQQQQQQ